MEYWTASPFRRFYFSTNFFLGCAAANPVLVCFDVFVRRPAAWQSDRSAVMEVSKHLACISHRLAAQRVLGRWVSVRNAGSFPAPINAKLITGPGGKGFLLRRSRTIVARHKVPGKAVIGDPSRRVRCEALPLSHKLRAPCLFEANLSTAADHAVPYGTDSRFRLSRHDVPGYHHSVPPGRLHRSRRHADRPICRYAHTRLRCSRSFSLALARSRSFFV